MREWLVAGAVVEQGDGVLLVCNQRRNGAVDWSTPGGVVDESDATVRDGLAREVAEETGLRITGWEGPLYEVVATAVDLGWRMRCEVYRAVAFEGDLVVDDPDGIVVEAAFVPASEVAPRLRECFPWVGEPLLEWLEQRFPAPRQFHYAIRGSSLDTFEVVRDDP